MSRARIAFLLVALALAGPAAAQSPKVDDKDLTLRAMRDEMQRSRERLRLGDLERPYYIEYRLLDSDVKTVTASFGALVSANSATNRAMAVDVRVGDYQFDSSNFVADDAFRGFIGSTGQVGIDRDYESLRQDLWLSTDQAYKAALDSLSRKRGFVRTLARAPEIPDFSREAPMVRVDPRAEPAWTSRNWEQEAKDASSFLRSFPQLYGARISYHLAFYTYYLMTSEGTEIRIPHSVAAIEASLDAPSEDGRIMHHFYVAYANRPAGLPSAAAVKEGLERVARELMALRSGPPAPDYIGPVLFDPRASASLMAQMLGPSISGARPALSTVPVFDEIMGRLGGRSEWVGRVSTRVLPAGVTIVDDPTARDFKGQPLLGGYEVDAEGVKAQRVVLVENGTLKSLLMSRRPGPDFTQSNGHARSLGISDARPMISNLFVESSDAVSPAELRKRFIDLCRAEGREWCVVVRQMDNPTLSIQRQEDFTELLSAFGGGSGDRVPLLVYRVYVKDGREELIRGARLSALTLRSMRNLAGMGNDPAVFNFFQNAAPFFAGTALSAFGSAQGGVPASVIAPSLLLEDVEIRGARGEPRRPPLVPPPPLN